VSGVSKVGIKVPRVTGRQGKNPNKKEKVESRIGDKGKTKEKNKMAKAILQS